MQVTTGTVVNGKVVVEGTTLPEGAVVAVLSRGAEESFKLSSMQEDELLAAIAEIERGEFVGLEELLASLPNPRRG
jgi:predicted transcriptional regulator